MVKNKIYFELRSATEKDLQEEVFIDSIQLINSTKPYDLELINDDYNNCYPYYRRLWGSINYQLIYGYNISVSCNSTITKLITLFQIHFSIVLQQYYDRINRSMRTQRSQWP